ncbi:MAG: hypothetical protein U0350_37695 [Caldilineaceae bacterium]
MSTQTLAAEQKLINIVRTLPPSGIEELLDFALFIQARVAESAQVVNHINETESEILADEARWDQQFAASSEKLRALGRQARANFYAGHTTAIKRY